MMVTDLQLHFVTALSRAEYTSLLSPQPYLERDSVWILILRGSGY